MSKYPYISIVIPAYNEAKFLSRCLESLNSQIDPPSFEVIVVDNNSTDDTEKIAKLFGAKVINEKTQGVSFAREAGRRAASGKIIISTDADCFFKPNWLQNIEKFYKDHADASGLAGHYIFYKGPFWSLVLPTMGALLVWMVSMLSHKVIYASAANLSFPSEYFTGYDTKYFQGSDERGVIKQIQTHGRVYVSLKNPVYTSSRRINQGFWHSILVTIGYYYTYNAFSTKKHDKSKIGAMPAIRDENRFAHWKILVAQWVFMAIILMCGIWVIYG